jgi:hypothetical protein
VETSDPAAAGIAHPLARHSSAFLFPVPSEGLEDGEFFMNAKVTIRNRGRTQHVLNDNLPGTSKAAFRGWITGEPLPGNDRAAYGDLHVHSHYSRSHVEFGPPLSIVDSMAEAYGLDFVAVTDHSYDLSSRPDNFLAYDPDAERWRMLLAEAAQINGRAPRLMVGEEVSASNALGRTVHVCGLGLERFVPGSRDGARFSAPRDSTLPLTEAMEAIHEQGGLAMAAHPGALPGMLERLLLGRGSWDAVDVSEKVDIFQALNNGFVRSWFRARRLWIELLLSRRRLPLAAGNDSHGDFNRYRSVGVPFLSVHEDPRRYLSYSRTGIYGNPTTMAAITEGLRQGRTFVTTGPFLDLHPPDSPHTTLVGGDVRLTRCRTITVSITSSYEYGFPCLLRVFRGYYDAREEKPLVVRDLNERKLNVLYQVEVDDEGGPGYIRAEALCRRDDGQTTQAATSPCYLID